MNNLKNNFLLLCSAFTFILFLSCQKNIDYVKSDVQLPDLVTKVTSSVSGFVTDENNNAVMSANVTVGGSVVTTDKYGYFEVKNIQVVKNAAVVTVVMPGYFKGIKTYIAENNKAVFFRIKLIPKINTGSIDAAAGGNVTLSNGLIVALPANAVVKAADNAPYTGTINVASHWIDPTESDLNQTMPGDLRGTATDGSLKLLQTFGMAAVELTSASGELLQIAAGKKATLTLTIPSSILASAPSTIPLWSFDETKGLWKQEGNATKTGNTYVGDVSHFSFWNYDLPANYVQFNCTLKDAAGNPIPYMAVKITDLGTNNVGWGIVDATTGYVSGAIPANAQLLLEVYPLYCGNVVYSQNFSTTNANLSLGDITITSGSQLATITGTVTDCSNNPVTDGYVIVNDGYYNYRYEVTNGTFTIQNFVLCNGTATVTLIAEDNIGLQQNTPASITVSSGVNAIGNIQACGTSIQQFITYTIDGGSPISLIYPADTLYQDANGTSAIDYISGHSGGVYPSTSYVSFAYDNTGATAGSSQSLLTFNSSQLAVQTNIASPTNVHITEYGAIGEFISGNFTATVINTSPPASSYTIVCSFRVRRNY